MSGYSLSISQSLSVFVSLSLSISVLLTLPIFFYLLSQSFFFPLWLSFPELAPSSFPVFASFCAFRIIGLQSQSWFLNHVLPYPTVSCQLPPHPLLRIAFCFSLEPTLGEFIGCEYPCCISILIAQLLQGPGIYFFAHIFYGLGKMPPATFGWT